MKKLFILFSLILISAYCLQISKADDQGTNVIFYIEHEVQQPQDYVEIKIQIKSQQSSLEAAINQATDIVTKVKTVINNYCIANAKNKKQCDNVVQTSQYEIQPIYQIIRKAPVFLAFSVTYQTTAKIQNVKNIGKLADDILKSGVSKINSFQWKPNEQIDIEEQAVGQGMQLVNNICAKIGLSLDKIVAVSQVSDYEDEQQQEQQQEQEEQEQEQDKSVVYRFEIICKDKKGKK